MSFKTRFPWLFFSHLLHIHLLGCLIFGGLTMSASATEYRLKYYDYPRVEGASWLYHFDNSFEEGWPSTELARVTLTDAKWELELTPGSGFSRPASRFVEERGYWDGKGFDLSKIFERSCNYRSAKRGGCYYYGYDRLSDKGSPGKVGYFKRMDRGLVLPESLRVGETYSSKTDCHDKKKYLGVAYYSVRLVSHGSVKVRYGTFKDCIRLKFVIHLGGQTTVTDEWWARGIGMVKSYTKADGDSLYELEGLRLQGDRPVKPTILECTPASPELVFTRMYELTYPDYYRVHIGEEPQGSLRIKFEIRNSGDGTIRNLLAELRNPSGVERIIKAPAKNLMPGEATFLELEIDPVYYEEMHSNYFGGCEFRLSRENGNDERNVTLMIQTYFTDWSR